MKGTIKLSRHTLKGAAKVSPYLLVAKVCCSNSHEERNGTLLLDAQNELDVQAASIGQREALLSSELALQRERAAQRAEVAHQKEDVGLLQLAEPFLGEYGDVQCAEHKPGGCSFAIKEHTLMHSIASTSGKIVGKGSLVQESNLAAAGKQNSVHASTSSCFDREATAHSPYIKIGRAIVAPKEIPRGRLHRPQDGTAFFLPKRPEIVQSPEKGANGQPSYVAHGTLVTSAMFNKTGNDQLSVLKNIPAEIQNEAALKPGDYTDVWHLYRGIPSANGGSSIYHAHVRLERFVKSFELSVCQIAAKILHGEEGACATNEVPAVADRVS